MYNFAAAEPGSVDRGNAGILSFKGRCYQGFAYPIIRPFLFPCKLPGGKKMRAVPRSTNILEDDAYRLLGFSCRVAAATSRQIDREISPAACRQHLRESPGD